MTKQEWSEEFELTWRRVVVNYYCDCIEHVLPYAQLPEFESAVLVLRQWADNRIDRDTMKTVYREFKRFIRPLQGSTPVSEIALAIEFAFYWGAPVHGRQETLTSNMHWCSEARLLATERNPLSSMDDILRAYKTESDWQRARWAEVESPLDKYNGGWRAHKHEFVAAA